jgi:hypothetical protein
LFRISGFDIRVSLKHMVKTLAMVSGEDAKRKRDGPRPVDES